VATASVQLTSPQSHARTQVQLSGKHCKLLGAHQGIADLLNASSASEIVFGPNMTTLTFALSRAIGRELAEGDEVLITRLDHDANRAPWLALAERGIAATRQLARRQLTWLRAMREVERLDCLRPGLAAEATGRVGRFLDGVLNRPRGT